MSRTIIDGVYNIDFLPTQRKIMHTALLAQEIGYPVNICNAGGFGSGKTRFVGEFALQIGLQFPGVEIGIFRKTRTAIVDTTYKDFENEVLPPEIIREHNQTRLEFTLTNGTFYHFFGIDRMSRKASLRFDIAIIDEGIELEEEDYIMIEGRLRGKILKHPLLVVFTNTGSPEHYLCKRFVNNEEKIGTVSHDKYTKYFATTSFENIHNPKSYFERLERWKGTQYYLRWVMCQWLRFKGYVYHNYDKKKHVIPAFEIPWQWKKYITMDFGFDHPLVFLWIAVDSNTGSEYVYRQYYKSHILLRKAIEICKKITVDCSETILNCWCDHDAECRAQVDEDWMQSSPANKEVDMGIQDVFFALEDMNTTKSPQLHIFDDSMTHTKFKYGLFDPDEMRKEDKLPICLQDEIGEYRWGKDDAPIKEKDDACDALRYYEHSKHSTKHSTFRGQVMIGTGFSRG